MNSFDLNITIYNPSKVRQKYSYREYLPKELKIENIIDNGGFVIVYDESKGALLASAEFDLEAKATIKKTIRMQNVWYIAERELNEIKNKAVEYYAQLEKGQYFPQALILKNDLDIKIDKILKLQRENANSAENLISIYQDNLLSLDIAKQNLEGLKNLIDHKEPPISLGANIAGIAASSPANIVIALLLNLILLIIILVHILRQHRAIKKHLGLQSSTVTKKYNSKPSRLKKIISNIFGKIKHHLGGLLAVLFILILAAVLYWLLNIYKLVPREPNITQNINQSVQNLPTDVATSTDSFFLDKTSDNVQTSSTTELGVDDTNNQGAHHYVLVKNTPLGSLNVRSEPSKTAKLINVVHDGDKLEVSEIKANPNNDQFTWYRIIWPDNKIGWIYGQYVEEF